MNQNYYLNKLTLIGLFLLIANSTFGQRPQNIRKFILTGIVIDQETEQPLEYATITLKNQRRPENASRGYNRCKRTFFT